MVLSRGTWPAPLAIALVAAVGCGDGARSDPEADQDDGERPRIVATTPIWADLAGMVACDGSAEVRSLVPAGGDAHAYEPSLRDRETLDDAALVVANGLGFEELLADTLDEVAARGTPVFEVGDHVDTLMVDTHRHDAEDDAEDEGNAHGTTDPHVWLDPVRVIATLTPLADALAEAGTDPDVVASCLASAHDALADLDADLAEILGAVPAENRLLVTNHDALGYLADRYGFTILGTVLPSTSTLTEANPARLEELANAIEAAGVPAIFTESLGSGTDARALADRLDVAVVELTTDTLGEPGTATATYLGMMRDNAARIVDALAD